MRGLLLDSNLCRRAPSKKRVRPNPVKIGCIVIPDIVTITAFIMSEIQNYLRDLKIGGFCLVENVVPADQCELLENRMIELAQSHRVKEAEAKRVSFIPGVINYDPSIAPFVADSRVLAIAERALESNIRISFTSAIINDAGKERTNWHADWPFNQNSACHIPAPYPDRIMHLTSLLMLTPFTGENGGTLVLPGSHRYSSNPTDENLGIDPYKPQPTEFRVTGKAGTLLLFDSRLWHCPPANPSNKPRVALAIRYAPWWLNLAPLDPDSEMRKQWVDEPSLKDNVVPRMPKEVYESLPETVKPLYRHWALPCSSSCG